MEKWEIRPDPKAADPGRHLLFVKGGLKDVAAIIHKLGAACGRPSSSRVPKGYNFRLALHRQDAAGLDKIRSFLNGMLPRPAPPVLPAPPAPGPKLRAAPSPAPRMPVAPKLKPAAPAPSKSPGVPVRKQAAPALPPAEPFVKVWHTRQKLDPFLSFESLLVGPYNRFAHAAAASVVGSPGTMYNPLFLYGPPASGKTHLIHASARGLAEAFGEEQVIFTSGPRLSHAANIAVTRAEVIKLESFFKTSRALVVDDFHLLAVSEDNQGFLSRIFDHFIRQNLQVILSSLYAPRALGTLEEALKISLKKGWSVDLKTPSAAVQLEIAAALFERGGVSLQPSDINALEEVIGADYLELMRWVKRLTKLIRFHKTDVKEGLRNLFGVLFPAATAPIPSREQIVATRFAPPRAGPGSRGLAFVLTREDEPGVPWIMQQFYAGAGPLRLPQAYRHALTQIYDANQPFGAPFQIGESCLSAGAQAALVIGPPEKSPLAVHAAEFSHAVIHVLESLGLSVGWIANSGETTAQDFMRAHLDLLEPGS